MEKQYFQQLSELYPNQGISSVSVPIDAISLDIKGGNFSRLTFANGRKVNFELDKSKIKVSITNDMETATAATAEAAAVTKEAEEHEVKYDDLKLYLLEEDSKVVETRYLITNSDLTSHSTKSQVQFEQQSSQYDDARHVYLEKYTPQRYRTLTRSGPQLGVSQGKNYYKVDIPDGYTLVKDIEVINNIFVLTLKNSDNEEFNIKIAQCINEQSDPGYLKIMYQCGTCETVTDTTSSSAAIKPEQLVRKPVIYYYGYPSKQLISTAVELSEKQQFFELTPGFNTVINVNTALFTDLKQLPGIGNALAKNIIVFRQKTPFTSFDNLLNVPGLGRVILNRIKPFIGLNNTSNYWTVTQSPDNDGSVIDCVTGKQYPYLFWESIFEEPIFTLNKQRSFCVKKHDLFHFLTEKLSILGLNANESKAFIEFWVPLLTDSKFDMYSYIIVEFLEDTYIDKARLHIEPKPDQLIRVFANFQFSAEPVICGEPELEQIQRSSNGTLVVEWGGTESVPDSIGNTQNSTILSCPTFM